MVELIAFQMWEESRQEIIKKHEFFVDQAKTRLLLQFSDIEDESERVSATWLEEKSKYFDPDRHDPIDFCENAEQVGIEFYHLLSEMHDQTRLGVIVGFTHEWEKTLRQWLVDQVNCLRQHGTVSRKLWSVPVNLLFELFESFGWELRLEPYFNNLEACRLVVNVHKHGDGPSFRDLAENFPCYLKHPLEALAADVDERWLKTEYTDLTLSDDHLEEFSDAIVNFWQNLPADVSEAHLDNLPGWFTNALAQDRVK